MSSGRTLSRFFANPFTDYDANSNFAIDRNYWSNYLSELAIVCMKKTKLNDETCDGGLYVGSLGVVYMIDKVLSNGYCNQYENDLKKYSRDCIAKNDSYFDSNGNMRSSFLLGNCGLYTVASLVCKHMLNDDGTCSKYASAFQNATKICEKDGYLKCGSDELLVGRAGILCAYLFYRNKLKIEVSYFL